MQKFEPLYPALLTQSVELMREQIALAKEADREFINSALSKIAKESLLLFKEYDKLIGFLSLLMKSSDQKEQFAIVKTALQSVGNKAVSDQYITPEGRMPNASLMVGFRDSDKNTSYVVMIRNDKFHEFTTPAGKIDKKDVATNENLDGVNLEQTYCNAALREFCEEAIAPYLHGSFLNFLAQKGCKPTLIDRDALGIPEFNKDYDTRLYWLNLGDEDFINIETYLIPDKTNNPDASMAFCLNVDRLAYDKLEAEQSGKFTNHFITLKLFDEEVRLKVRPTMLIALNGPQGQPELGKVQELAAVKAPGAQNN